MFRMKFETRDTTGEDEENYAWKGRPAESVGWSPEPAPTVTFEGRVGKLGRIQRYPNPDKTVAQHDSSLHRLDSSPNPATVGSKSSTDADFEGTVQDAEVPRYAVVFDVDVHKEPVNPHAESLHVKIQGSAIETLTDNNVIVTNVHYLTSVKRQDAHMDSASSHALARREGRLDSVRGGTPDTDAEGCSSDTNEGSLAREIERGAVTGNTNKLMQNRKLNDRFATPLEEPLLAAHDQAKLNLVAKAEAAIETERLAEEEHQNLQRRQRELQDLASCVGTATTPGDYFKKRKLQKILRLLKSPFWVCQSQKINHVGWPNSRVAEVTNPNTTLFSGCRTVPSGPLDSVQPSMGNFPQRGISRPNFQFAKVDSTNGDVPTWTRGEYLRKNGKIEARKDDEDFGSVLGNNYLNNNVATGMASSDSDSDSD